MKRRRQSYVPQHRRITRLDDWHWTWVLIVAPLSVLAVFTIVVAVHP